MKQDQTAGKSASAKPTLDPAPKKVYQRPSLRTFGSLHVMTQGTGAVNGDAGQSMMPGMGGGSDRSIKENIVRIGDHPLGIGLYLFDYKFAYRAAWGQGRQFGVMADEVERVMPEAVATHADGYKLVDYAMLGISRAV
jgi:hypothetical protein